jgi:hypothetical protein
MGGGVSEGEGKGPAIRSPSCVARARTPFPGRAGGGNAPDAHLFYQSERQHSRRDRP